MGPAEALDFIDDTDKKFYLDDRVHPLQETAGIIVLDIAPEQSAAIFGMFEWFVKRFPMKEWAQAKAFVSSSGFRFKRLGKQGENVFVWDARDIVQVESWI